MSIRGLKLPVTILGLLCCRSAGAQDVRTYIFFAPGGENPGAAQGTSSGFVPPPVLTPPGTSGTQPVFGAGGGMELALPLHLGIGAEISGIVPSRNPTDTLGNFSLNGYIHACGRDHLCGRNQNLDPYFRTGYTVFFRDFTANGFNVGGGLNYWFRERIGLVLGVSWEHEFGTSQNFATTFWTARIGMTFR
jgi:hypothetical protein